MDTTFIYALNDPETGECRYVGKTNDLKKTFRRHMRDGRTKIYHKAYWIKSLITRGLKPLMEVLQEVPETDWKVWERAWIKASRKLGMDLTNGTDGGDCGPVMRGEKHPMFGKHHPPAVCVKISAAKIGKKLTSAQYSKRGAARLGGKHKNSKSTFRGVNWRKGRDNWRVRITVSGNVILVGSFSNEIEAAKAYDSAAIKYYGESAKLNFP